MEIREAIYHLLKVHHRKLGIINDYIQKLEREYGDKDEGVLELIHLKSTNNNLVNKAIDVLAFLERSKLLFKYGIRLNYADLNLQVFDYLTDFYLELRLAFIGESYPKCHKKIFKAIYKEFSKEYGNRYRINCVDHTYEKGMFNIVVDEHIRI